MSKPIRSGWTNVVLVCGKCSKKLDGGFGAEGDASLAKVLRKRVGKGRRATLGVVEVKCLGVCPKGAVVLVDAARPETWELVRPGTDVGVLADRLASSTRLPRESEGPPTRPRTT